MSLKCCNKVCQILEEIDLRDAQEKTHRLLIIGRCKNPKCGALRAQILSYNTNKQKFVYETIRGKDVKKKIEELKNNPYYTIEKEKQGSAQNQNWIYGQTKYIYNKTNTIIEHWACNFNGERKLIEKKFI